MHKGTRPLAGCSRGGLPFCFLFGFDTQLSVLQVRRPFILGCAESQWKPTISQMFVRLLHDNGLLLRLYTQNIDGLDFDVGLPPEKIVCVHGSIRQTMCESCHEDPYEGDYNAYIADVKTHIKDIYSMDASAPAESTPIVCRTCGAHCVKPTTVLFGASLPHRFFVKSGEDFGSKGGLGLRGDGVISDDPKMLSDMMFVIGTSLKVYPAAALPECVSNGRPRILVNGDAAGDFDYTNRDCWLHGDIDEKLLELIIEIGWLDQLVRLQDGLCEASQHRVAEAAAVKAEAHLTKVDVSSYF